MGKRIPASQLQAIAQKSQHLGVTNLMHPLKLLGTRNLHDYITLFRSPINTAGTMHKELIMSVKCIGEINDIT